MLRRRPSVALLLALSFLLVAACSRPAAAPPAPAPVTTTVRILYDPWDEGLVNALIAAFYQQNAQICIDKVLMDPRAKPEDRGAQIKAKAANGEVDLIPTYQVPDLDRVALPLDDRLRSAGLDLKPYGQLLDLVRINGTLFQLPYAINPTVIMYNPDLFARAGLNGPAAGWTWGDLRIAAATLTGGPAAARSWGLASTLGNATVAQGPQSDVHARTGAAAHVAGFAPLPLYHPVQLRRRRRQPQSR